MPEKRDEEFSEILFERFKVFANSLGVTDFLIEIEEKYSHEETPHYHLVAGSEPGCHSFFERCCFSALYSATADEIICKGVAKINVNTNVQSSFNKVLVSALFAFYDECIRESYLEWKTIYNQINFPN